MLCDLSRKELPHLPPHPPLPPPPPPPPPPAVSQTVAGDSTLGAGRRHTADGGEQEQAHILVGRRTLKNIFSQIWIFKLNLF